MTTKTIRILKPVVFVLTLLPFLGILVAFRNDTLGTDPVQAITHYTGDWAVWTLLASLVITPVRRFVPKLGWLIRFRRMMGLFAFFYATMHLLTYVLLFSGFDLPGALVALRAGDLHTVRQDWVAVWPTMVEDVAKRRFIQVGLASYVILLALAVTSPQFVMMKMGGKSWQTLHRMVYFAAVLAAIHYWWMVKKGVTTPWKDSAVLAVLLLARWAYVLLKKKPPVRAVAVA